ncbi:hypothetical protein, partial [Cysteiniphilum litorale]|uniref:hypothetical protein n=1 Tax=Cysteiniphilum litorale TaxID=2056700 RepID=UPI003F883B50
MTDLKIILNNTNNPDKPSEISIGETRLAGRFFNHDLGRNATVSVRNADIKSDAIKREKSSRDHDELDYVSGNILIEVVKNYLNNQLSMNNQDGKYILNDQDNRHIEFFKTLHSIISSKEFLDGLKDNHTKLRDIFKEVEGKNPGHKDLATDIMKQAIREAAIAGLKKEPFNLSKFLTQKSMDGQKLTWPDSVIKKANGLGARIALWFKNAFRKLFNTGLGKDTYLKCSLVDDQIESSKASKEAGNLLKEFYIDSVNNNLRLDKFLEGKAVGEDVKADIILINNHVNSTITSPSSKDYNDAESRIKPRFETYDDIAKQLNEQKFYKDLSEKANKLNDPTRIQINDKAENSSGKNSVSSENDIRLKRVDEFENNFNDNVSYNNEIINENVASKKNSVSSENDIRLKRVDEFENNFNDNV